MTLAFPLALSACVKVDGELGKDLIDKSLLYDTYTVEFPIEDIRLRRADDLSGFSDSRLAIGAIRDDTFGLTTRSSAFTLIPSVDTLDLGIDPQLVRFSIHFAADTVSCADASQKHILQNFYVYELTDTLSSKDVGTNKDIPHGKETVTRGIPVYDGSDSLSFEFSEAFGRKYIDVLKRLGPELVNRTEGSKVNKYSDFITALPGIYIESNLPEGLGGRINLFELSTLTVSSNYYRQNNNNAVLTIRSTYNGVRKDTSFLFVPGEAGFYDEAAYLKDNQKFYQYAFNRTSHEAPEGVAVNGISIEGGGGLKPVFPMAPIQKKVLAAIREKAGGNEKIVARTVVNKASIILPFEMPEDPTLVDLFPSMLSPTIRNTNDDGVVSFGGLTDASASSENQGTLDRSNRMYAPDITYHMQEVLQRDDLDTKDNADI